MYKPILILTALALLLVSLGAASTPSAAHQNDCLVTAHQGKTQLHLLCATSANTCFMNAQHASGEVNVVCFMPEPQPCVVKAKAEDHKVVVCTNHVGVTDD